MSLVIRCRDGGKEVRVLGDRAEIEEAHSYEFHTDAKAATIGGMPLGRDLTGAFLWSFEHWVGSTTLELSGEGAPRRVSLVVRPREEKLSVTQWNQLLVDLETWLPAITVGLEGGERGSVGLGGAPAGVLAAALLPLVPRFVRALERVADAPREEDLEVRPEVPMHSVRRVTADALRWLARHPVAAGSVTRWRSNGDATNDPTIPVTSTIDTVDHPVNRYVAWLMNQVEKILVHVAADLEKASKASDLQRDTADWCRMRSQTAKHAVEALTGLRRRTFLRTITPTPPSEAALLALLDDPAYAAVHSIGRRFLSPLFQNIQGAEPAPVRPSYTIFELWVFLRVKQDLERALEAALPGWEWKWKGKPPRVLLAGAGEGSRFEATRSGATLTIHFNETFSGFLSVRKPNEPFSLTATRRPDVVVSWSSSDGTATWVCLDAKYRVGRSNLEDAFESAHIYRDSLQWTPFGGPCRAVALLAPNVASETSAWFSDGFLGAHGLGAIQVTPGQEKCGVAPWIIRSLGMAHEPGAVPTVPAGCKPAASLPTFPPTVPAPATPPPAFAPPCPPTSIPGS